ncbi:MAG: ArsR family transcriptional regulator [Parcubacteria group bacterium Gr01-1014_29]|nr:MAG: ArsR family transcriptional regulator [Parcubacteria group bacterium Gr01-1014_29]
MTNKNKTCAGCFRTLSDATRVRIIQFLKTGGEKNVNAITKPLGVSQPTVSHHLRLLTDAGFLLRRKQGKEALYSFRDDYPCNGCGVFHAPIRT